MWQCRTLVVPVMLGALGTVHAGIARWLEIIPGHHNLQNLRKQCLLDPVRSYVKSCVLSRQSRHCHSHDGLSTSEAGFASVVTCLSFFLMFL